MGLSHSFQDYFRDVSIQACIWESVSSSGGARAQSLLAIKKINLDAQLAGERRFLELNEMEEFQNLTYDSARLYKERMKRWHDQHILSQHFAEGQQVLLCNSRLRLFPGKLKSRWFGPFIMHKVYPHRAVDLKAPDSDVIFKVNGQRLMIYNGAPIMRDKVDVYFLDT
ncbi:hypothetical protein GQ457_12G015850 [Hibiscus cannabinus]